MAGLELGPVLRLFASGKQEPTQVARENPEAPSRAETSCRRGCLIVELALQRRRDVIQ